MSHIYAPRAKETTSTSGTGTLNLSGAVAQFQTFVAGVGSGNTTAYTIVDANGTGWEEGVGTVTSGSPATLSRTTITGSSNAGAAITLSAGTHTVFCTIPASVPQSTYSSVTSRIMGRKSAGAGTQEACTLSEVLDFIGSAAQGDILYRGASTWARLGAGTSGYALQTGGAGANPSWTNTLTSYTFNTPNIGVATATTVNKVTITAPSTSATLTVANGKTLTANSTLTLAGTDGKTFTVNNTITFSGTDSTTFTLPPVTANLGYLGAPQNSKSADYTLVIGDAGNHIFHPSADTTARTFTIPANASVAFPIGTIIRFANQDSAGVITIAITTDTLRLSPGGTTGSRSLAANGLAMALKLSATEWIISGTGLT